MDMKKLIKGRYEVAFAKKSNAQRYAKEVGGAGVIRSTGPTVDAKGIHKAYYVFPHKKR